MKGNPSTDNGGLGVLDAGGRCTQRGLVRRPGGPAGCSAATPQAPWLDFLATSGQNMNSWFPRVSCTGERTDRAGTGRRQMAAGSVMARTELSSCAKCLLRDGGKCAPRDCDFPPQKGRVETGDTTGIKSTTQEIVLLRLLKMHGVRPGLSTRIVYLNFLKSPSVLLGSFYGAERILSYSLTKPGTSGFFSKALNAAPKPFNNYLVNWETVDFVNWASVFLRALPN